MSVNIRELTVDDSLYVVDMLVDVVAETGDKWIGEAEGLNTGKKVEPKKNLTSEQKKKIKEEEERVGKKVVAMLVTDFYKYSRPKLVTWFADLCQMSEDEWKKSKPVNFIKVVKHLTTSPDAKDFFTEACQLFKEINPFAGYMIEEEE